MPERREPRLRTVERYKPPYPLNRLPGDFAFKLGKEIVYLLATRGEPRLEGSDWEQIFARIINAEWRPSNVGLDDIVLEQTAWGAKTVKNAHPAKAKKVRLISGRNSTLYSFNENEIANSPIRMGEKVLSIWNERVASVRRRFKHLRTIVLIKSNDLLEVAAFEFDTIMFDFKDYDWSWNSNKNLVGHKRNSSDHKFTWQPHGSQFTIIENVPSDKLAIRVRQPTQINRDRILQELQFDESWVEVISSS